MSHVKPLRRTLVTVGLTGSFLACAGLLAASAACAAAPAEQRTTYVAKGGADSSPGTSSAPLRTIGAAVAKTPSGGRIIVGSGSYHESLTLVGKSDVTVMAASGASVWLDGSRVVSNWKQDGQRWVATGWTAQFDSSPTFTKGAPDNTEADWRFVNPAHPMAAHPDQVWIDGVAQQQVGSVAKVTPRSFYVDYATSRLYLGSNPTGHSVRASDLAKAISIRDPGTTISGINVHRFAPSVPMMGAVTVERPNVTLRSMRIIDNAATGLFVGDDGARLTDLTLEHNGLLGLHGNRADNLTLDHVLARYDNAEHFNPSPSAGGAKIGRSSHLRVANSRFSHNNGTGLWLDESVYDFRVFGSRLVSNTNHGMSLEISGTGRVADNVIALNGGNGIKINDTDHVEVWNNSLVGNGRSINIVQDHRDVDLEGSYRDFSLPMTLRNEYITVRNNIMASPRSSANCLLCVEDYSNRFSAAQLHVSADANVYQRQSSDAPRWLVVWSRGKGDPAVFTTLQQMQTATGQERQGQMLTGTAAVVGSYAPADMVNALALRTAYGAPGWVADAAHVSPGAKRLGSWRS